MPEEREYIGGYKIVRRLGQGGMGVVYLAEGSRGQRVALKVIHAAYAGDESYQRRFLREIEILRRISTQRLPRIAVIVDYGVDDGLYLVTELVEGVPLTDRIRDVGPLSPDELHDLGLGLITALRGLHGVNVIHRDLKPGNVLLGPAGPTVIDFGIAQLYGASATVTQTAVGTAGFMSPEQVRGEPLTPASDVFSWGAVMAYAATGRPPFGMGSPSELSYRSVYTEPDLDGLDGNLQRLIRWALRKNPAARPDLEQLPALLEGTSSDLPVPEVDVMWTAVESPPALAALQPTALIQRLAGLVLIAVGMTGVFMTTGPLKIASAMAPTTGLVLLVAPLPWTRTRRRIGAIAALTGLLLPVNAATGIVPLGERACVEATETRSRALEPTGFNTASGSEIYRNADGLWTIRAKGGYTWTGLQAPLPNWCSFQVDLDVTVRAATQTAFPGMGWGYGIGVCSRFDGSQPRGPSLQYAFYQSDQNDLNHVSVVALPDANAFPEAQPQDPPNGLDYNLHHWRITYDHGKVSYQYDYGAYMTPSYQASGTYPLLGTCLDSGFLLRAWLAEVEVDNITLSPS